jgi:hypothetical protein
MSPVRWLTAMLDTPEERAAEAEAFWCAVTGQRLSSRRGRGDEFATLLPEAGDPFLRVQTVGQSPPGGMHLDLHTDVGALAHQAEVLGANTSYAARDLVLCGSPGGMTFCIVGPHGTRRPPAPHWPGGRSAVDQVCLDIPPDRFDAECAFWAELSGWPLRESATHAEFARLLVPARMALHVLLQRLDDTQHVVTAHLDLACEDRDAEAARHLDLGASVVRRTDGWTTLRDPAGRAYCVTSRPVEPG